MQRKFSPSFLYCPVLASSMNPSLPFFSQRDSGLIIYIFECNIFAQVSPWGSWFAQIKEGPASQHHSFLDYMFWLKLTGFVVAGRKSSGAARLICSWGLWAVENWTVFLSTDCLAVGWEFLHDVLDCWPLHLLSHLLCSLCSWYCLQASVVVLKEITSSQVLYIYILWYHGKTYGDFGTWWGNLIEMMISPLRIV